MRFLNRKSGSLRGDYMAGIASIRRADDVEQLGLCSYWRQAAHTLAHPCFEPAARGLVERAGQFRASFRNRQRNDVRQVCSGERLLPLGGFSAAGQHDECGRLQLFVERYTQHAVRVWLLLEQLAKDFYRAM